MTPQRLMMILLTVIFFIIVGWYIVGCPGVTVCPFLNKKEDPPKSVTLHFVGPWDKPSDWGDIAAAFNAYKKQEENGYMNVSIVYKQIDDYINYEEVVKEMQFEDQGPNIFMVFHSWIPRYEEKIQTVPESIMTLDKFKKTYATAAVEDLTVENENKGKIYALPFYIDTPALYYNTKMFLNENLLEYPKNWVEFEKYVEKLTYYKKENGETVSDENGNPIIDIAGAAFGGGSNINRSQDIVMILTMQNNYDEKNIVSFDKKGAYDAIKYYIDFTDPQSRFYTWNKDEMFSIDAFTQRKAAMMINYSKEIPNIESKTGGNMDYKIAPLPQLDDRRRVNYASYWVPVVAKKAPCNPEPGLKVNCYNLAWEFLNFASQKKYSKMYLDKTERAAANLEIAKEQSQAGDARSVFASQVFTARSWKNPDDSVADEKLLEMINFLIENDKNRKQIVQAMEIPKRYISEINR